METNKPESGAAVSAAQTLPIIETDAFSEPVLGLSLPPTAATPPPAARIHVQAHGLALLVLSTVAFVFALQWARDFFIPLIFGLFVSYTLNPVVGWMERIKIPRIVGTVVVMVALLGSAAGVLTSLNSQFRSILDQLPLATYQLTRELKLLQGSEMSALQKIRNAAKELQKVASPEPAPEESATQLTSRVAPTVSKPPVASAEAVPDLKIGDWLLKGSMGAVGFLGQMVMVLFLVFFFLLSGDTFKRKLVKITGPSFSQKKITVKILDDINVSVQRYMIMLLMTNVLLAFLTWAILSWIGLDNAGAWAVAAGLLHVIPYFGPVLVAALTGLAALMQFGTLPMMLLVSLSTLVAATLIGFFVTTWMTGRIAKMNATAVFIALLFGGWLWGVWGLLLVVPIVVVVKVVASHIEGLQSVVELLSE